MALSWTPVPTDPEIFHITHLRNLSSIIADGGLLCDAVMASRANVTTIGDPAIKSRRLTWTLNAPGFPRVGDFVPFYFCPRSVMLYRIYQGHSGWLGGQDEVLHLVSRVSCAARWVPGCLFTDASAATRYHQASSNLAQLPTAIDWTVMPLEQWSGPPMTPRQAEFLVPRFLPWRAIERIVVMTPPVARAVMSCVGPLPHAPLVTVDRSWYYG